MSKTSQSTKQRSTNPFDLSFDEEEESGSNNRPNDRQHPSENQNDGCLLDPSSAGTVTDNAGQDSGTVVTIGGDMGRQSTSRVAPLNFHQSFAGPATPALDFQAASKRKDSGEFFSPLEDALLQLTDSNMESPDSLVRNQMQTHVIRDHQGAHLPGETFRIAHSDSADERTALFQTPQKRYSHPSSKPRRDSRTRAQQRSSVASTASSAAAASATASATDRGPRRPSSIVSVTSRPDPVLRKLQVTDQNEFNMEYKLILLEDLGTASSWMVLLLPYAAFCLCLTLESFERIQVSKSDVIAPKSRCEANFTTSGIDPAMIASKHTYPLLPDDAISTTPCWATVLEEHSSSSSSNDNDSGSIASMPDDSPNVLMNGSAFESGILPSIPVLTTFIYMDSAYHALSTDIVASVAQQRIHAEISVLQESRDDFDNPFWSLMYKAPHQTLSMACRPTAGQTVYHVDRQALNEILWDCKSPRIMDLIFAMPATGVYGGGNLRFEVFYHFAGTKSTTNLDTNIDTNVNVNATATATAITKIQLQGFTSNVYTSSSRMDDALSQWNAAETPANEIVAALAQRSSYSIQHMSHFAMTMDSIVRCISIVLTLAFFATWCYKQGISSFFERCCCCCCSSRWRGGSALTNSLRGIHRWWESTWVVFPERRYVLLLLLGLLCIQGPALVVLYAFPHLGSKYHLRRAADAMNGIGIHCILFVYLCLFHGFRYHTDMVARSRTEHRRQIIQLRHAIKHVTAADELGGGSEDEEIIQRHMQAHFERFGDVDGSANNKHLRLQSDPCADGSIDFLCDKMVLLIVGVAAVITSVFSAFPPESSPGVNLEESRLDMYRTVFFISSVIQFGAVVAWLYLIAYTSLKTAQLLRREPFLSTRPAQLSFRIVFAHMALGLTALIVSVFIQGRNLFRKWHFETTSTGKIPNTDGDDAQGDSDVDPGSSSWLGIAVTVVEKVGEQFPYSGTAADVGAGRIIFATVSIIITAFIFLPSQTQDDNESSANANANASDRPDKTCIPSSRIDGRQPRIHDIETSSDSNSHCASNQRPALSKRNGDGFPGTLELIREHKQRKRDKRTVVRLGKDAKTWRVFPIPIQNNDSSQPLGQRRENGIQLYQDLHTDATNMADRGFVSAGPYTPVFCLEIAHWLSEASWQAYFTPAVSEHEVHGAEHMHLESIGLRLEGAVLDEITNIQAYVASNVTAQIDGDEDTIIVVAFRGTANAANVRTDFRSRQVPLLDQLTAASSASFCIRPDSCEIPDADNWIWDTPEMFNEDHVRCIMPCKPARPFCSPLSPSTVPRNETQDFSSDAKAILRSTPIAQNTFPLVHEGFQEVYCHIRRKLLNIIVPVYQRQLANVLQSNGMDESLEAYDDEPLALPKIYITGHSLGGSEAQLLALDLASNCEIVLPTKAKSTASDSVPLAAEVGGDIVIPEDEVFNLPSPEKRSLLGKADRSGHGAHLESEPQLQSYQQQQQQRQHLYQQGQQQHEATKHIPGANEEKKTELRLQPPIAVYTFGQPRVGNKAFASFYKQRVPHTFRVVNEGDAITSMPNRLCCGGAYKHAGLEVLLDEGQTGTILVGPTVVETVFRFHEVRTNVAAHTLVKYRESLEMSFAEHELQEYYQGHSRGKRASETANEGQRRRGTHGSIAGSSSVIPEWMVQVRTLPTEV